MERTFRVIEGTGEVVDCADCIRKDEEIELLEKELRAKRSLISKLRGERNNRKHNDPNLHKIQTLHEFWQAHCRRPKAILDDKRYERLSWALSHYEIADCTLAILGYAEFPYVVNKQREPHGKSTERYDDLELIFRTAAHVERGWKLAERAEEMYHREPAA